MRVALAISLRARPSAAAPGRRVPRAAARREDGLPVQLGRDVAPLVWPAWRIVGCPQVRRVPAPALTLPACVAYLLAAKGRAPFGLPSFTPRALAAASAAFVRSPIRPASTPRRKPSA